MISPPFRFSKEKFSKEKLYSCFESYQDFANCLSTLPKPVASEKPVFQASVYRSGELSAFYHLSGNASKVTPPDRVGPITTNSFSYKSRQKIRRAVENSTVDFKIFMTLTFAPGLLHPWHFAETTNHNFCGPLQEGQALPVRLTIRHDFAKYKLINFRKALHIHVKRQIAKNVKAGAFVDHRLKKHLLDSPEKIADYKHNYELRYVWAAELQDNGNIHFHILLNKFFDVKWLSRLWQQAPNSVDVKFLNDARHAANYISKYISSDNISPIKGNRYNINAIVRSEAKPMQRLIMEDQDAINAKRYLFNVSQGQNKEGELKEIYGKLQEVITSNGGRIIGGGFGIVLPYPRPSRPYRDKKTKKIKGRTHAVDGRLHDIFLDSLFGEVPF